MLDHVHMIKHSWHIAWSLYIVTMIKHIVKHQSQYYLSLKYTKIKHVVSVLKIVRLGSELWPYSQLKCVFLTVPSTRISRLCRKCWLWRCWHHRAGEARQAGGRAGEASGGVAITPVFHPGAGGLWADFAVAVAVAVDNCRGWDRGVRWEGDVGPSVFIEKTCGRVCVRVCTHRYCQRHPLVTTYCPPPPSSKHTMSRRQ